MKTTFRLTLAASALAALPAFAQDLPEGKGREAVAAACNVCHQLLQRVGGGYTPQGWNTVLRMMTNHGVSIAADKRAEITDYLVKTFPEKPKSPGLVVAGPVKVSMKSWPAATPGSRPHDPLATKDGALWYTGQMTNTLGRIDPKTRKVREFKLTTAHSGPHGLVEDKSGNVWYTGNTGMLVGKLEPKTGKVTEYKMPDAAARDPHTLVFDQAGILWFTAQNGNRVGRLDPATGEIKLLTPPSANSRPYGMGVDSKGTVYYVAFGTNKIGAVDPKTLAIREFTLPDAASRPRRMTITSDDIVWYADHSRGFVGRLDPATGKVTEYASPSGPKSSPYGMSAIKDVIWYVETTTKPNMVVRFDPKTEKFQSWPIPGGGDIVRNTDVTRDGNFVLANSLTNQVTLVTIGK